MTTAGGTGLKSGKCVSATTSQRPGCRATNVWLHVKSFRTLLYRMHSNDGVAPPPITGSVLRASRLSTFGGGTVVSTLVGIDIFSEPQPQREALSAQFAAV
jgi:hypothetical protein